MSAVFEAVTNGAADSAATSPAAAAVSSSDKPRRRQRLAKQGYTSAQHRAAPPSC